MARVTSGANYFKLGGGAAILTAPPCTFAAWFLSTNTNADQSLIDCDWSTNTNNAIILLVPVASKLISVTTNAAGTGATGDDGSTAIALSTWYHAAGVFASATSRTAYRNGVPGTVNTVSKVPTGINQTLIAYNAAARVLVGTIAFPAIWNIALSASDIASLAAGADPTLVRPGNLIGCPDLSGGANPEPDRVSATTWTVNGTPPLGVNPRIYRRN
jgi:Concanavalin A-like lectin/glucanases superfamily